MRIIAYCMEWHIGGSSAFHDLLVSPLKDYAEIDLLAWDGVSTECFAGTSSQMHLPMVFCMRPPPECLLSDQSRRLVWIPMLDNIEIKRYSEGWWESLPKTLRVVAFSSEVARLSMAAGLPTLSLRYYPDPNGCRMADWSSKKVMFYWNRRGLIPACVITRLCQVLSIDRLLFRPDIDSGVPRRKYYELPEKLGSTAVDVLEGIDSKESYLQATCSANIFIAPRGCEGVGLTFIEALTRGCAVFSYDGATMNEYIDHKINGFLFRKAAAGTLIASKLENCLTRLSPFHQRVHGYPFEPCQPWQEIGALDLVSLGSSARKTAESGYKVWQKSLSDYAKFIIEW